MSQQQTTKKKPKKAKPAGTPKYDDMGNPVPVDETISNIDSLIEKAEKLEKKAKKKKTIQNDIPKWLKECGC